MNRKRRWFIFAWLLSATVLIGCRCQDPEVLATLKEKHGVIERDFSRAVSEWQKATLGGEYRLGDGIRSMTESNAILKFNEGSLLRLTPSSQLRFLTIKTKQGKEGSGIDIETGTAELMVGEAEFSLYTSVGMATVASGSVLKLKKVDEGVAFEVEIGKATFFDKRNVPTEVSAGEGITVNIGAAVLEKFNIEKTPDTAASSPASPAAADIDTAEKVETKSTEPPEDITEVNKDSEQTVESKVTSEKNGHGGFKKSVADLPEGPPKADFRVAPGASFVVHAPSPPIAVSFDTAEKCPNGAAAQIGNKWAVKGKSDVKLVLEKGHHRYKIRCLDGDNALGTEVIGKGRIHVLKDAGVARLSGNPPTSFVETDGRRYKIMYQTRQPAIDIRWPKAPKGQKYKLHLDDKRQISTPKPAHVLRSGSLSEGTHRIKYEAIGTLARTSRTTTVEIRFDNAAPKASLTSPADGAFSVGSTVQVKGTAMANWRVKLLGGTIEKDEHHRFTGEVTHTGEFMSVVLRLSHSRRGIHYYIRRARGQGL